jgi:alkanesulfonate monooxygenase SsuD/methylene tetrahydromethanopterin reductase-like flavin-dependent oxidoreductase (luciferase family)
LIGTPDEIAERLDGLRRADVEYVIMSCGGSREGLRRFAREIMPAFADDREPADVVAARSSRGP